jgi:hypothetical protein
LSPLAITALITFHVVILAGGMQLITVAVLMLVINYTAFLYRSSHSLIALRYNAITPTCAIPEKESNKRFSKMESSKKHSARKSIEYSALDLNA